MCSSSRASCFSDVGISDASYCKPVATPNKKEIATPNEKERIKIVRILFGVFFEFLRAATCFVRSFVSDADGSAQFVSAI